MNLEYLSEDKDMRVQQLSLIIHNCKVYGLKVSKELIDEYNKLNKRV